jgi:ribosome-binding protein aMBF1 (putative translation factor)
MKENRRTMRDMFAEWREGPSYVREYDALDEEFALAAVLIDARAKAGLSQEEVAERMRTSQQIVSRLEGGRGNPSLKTLRRFAKATGTQLQIVLKSTVQA